MQWSIFRGALPVYVNSVRIVKVPPKIDFFMWLISHNKLFTRDNLVKRKNVDVLTFAFSAMNLIPVTNCFVRVFWRLLRGMELKLLLV
jgi:hypothetical protein